MTDRERGNIALGLLAGFFCGCFGLAIVAFVGKPDTRKGAVIGFVAQLMVGVAYAALDQLVLR